MASPFAMALSVVVCRIAASDIDTSVNDISLLQTKLDLQDFEKAAYTGGYVTPRIIGERKPDRAETIADMLHGLKDLPLDKLSNAYSGVSEQDDVLLPMPALDPVPELEPVVPCPRSVSTDCGMTTVEDLGRIAEVPEVSVSTSASCNPQCTWKCSSPVCDQVCEPVCKPAKCETRCSSPDISECSMACDKPQCSTVCPERQCASQQCPTCKSECTEAVCKLQCPEKQPCRNVCEEPQCEWECREPASCPKPECSMVCEEPRSCGGTIHRTLPALLPGEISVTSYSQGSLLQVDQQRLHVPVKHYSNVSLGYETHHVVLPVK